MRSPKPIVFVIDDDEAVRKSVKRLLASADYECETFKSANDFLARPVHAGPSCVIVDVRMPGLTGIEFQDALIKRRREEHAGEDPGAFLLDVKSRDLVDALIGDVVDYEEFGELYRSCIFHGDSVWKFAVATAALAVLFPALRFVWMVPLNHGVMTLYWMTAAVVGAGLLVTFVLYTGARNRLMRLLENHAN